MNLKNRVNIKSPLRNTEKEKIFLRVAQNMMANIKIDNKIFMITSSVSGEGKSELLLNIVEGLQLLKKKVLLIDGDFKNGRLSALFHYKNHQGFMNLINTQERVVPITIPCYQNINFIPSGELNIDFIQNYKLKNAKELLMEYKKEFDIIIIDAPPLRLIPESKKILQLAEQVLIVARENKVSKRALNQSINDIYDVNPKIFLGVLYNDSRERTSE